MVLTGERRFEPDIWPKTSEQAKNMENMMKIMWKRKQYVGGKKLVE